MISFYSYDKLLIKIKQADLKKFKGVPLKTKAHNRDVKTYKLHYLYLVVKWV